MIFQQWFYLNFILKKFESKREIRSILISFRTWSLKSIFLSRGDTGHLVLVLNPHTCSTPWPWNGLGLWMGYVNIIKRKGLWSFTWKYHPLKIRLKPVSKVSKVIMDKRGCITLTANKRKAWVYSTWIEEGLYDRAPAAALVLIISLHNTGSLIFKKTHQAYIISSESQKAFSSPETLFPQTFG